jgi:membrane protease YdiL (CAAX protease family)
VLIGAAAPIAEELFFRGYCQTRLSERWGPAVGVGVTSVLFGVFHMNLVQGLCAGVIGVYFGWSAERSGSVRPAMLAHMANNTFALALAMAAGPGPPEGTEGGGLALAVVLGSLVAAAAVWQFARAYPTKARATAPAALPACSPPQTPPAI